MLIIRDELSIPTAIWKTKFGPHMKRNYKKLIAILCLSATLFAFTVNSKKSVDPDKDKLLLELLTLVIKKGHYNPVAIDDNFSKGVYKEYIEALDPSKRF